MLVNIVGSPIKWQSVSIREVPVTTMNTLLIAAACSQAKVHIRVVCQRLAHEGDIRKGQLRVDLHQGPEETEGNDNHRHHYCLFASLFEFLCGFCS
ncbi:hypothetical protein GBAR_LOCUS15003, partial [Geodia barretti]